MKEIFIFSLLIFLLLSVSVLSQNDLIIINRNDPVTGKIVENSLDSVSYISIEDGKFYRVTENLVYVDSQYLHSVFKINHIQFAQNPGCEFSTQDLLNKLDFSSNSPNKKLVRDYSNYPNYKEIFDTINNKLYWFGIDYSRVKIRLGKDPREKYSELFFVDCNDYLLSQDGFTNFRKHFKFIIDTGIVVIRNNGISFSTIYNKKPQILALDSIRTILNGFNINHTGVGLIIFVTDINKGLEIITYYSTFFDLRSKTILLCLKETKKTSGVGMANHWTKPIIENLDFLIQKDSWKKRYSIKQ